MDSVKTLLQKDRIEDALEVWLQNHPSADVESELIQISARFQNYQRVQRSGTQSIEAMTAEKNRIRQDLLSLLGEVGAVKRSIRSPQDLPAQTIAFLESNPLLDRNLQSNIEHREITEILEKFPNRFTLSTAFAITLEGLAAAIDRYRPSVLHIVLFSTDKFLIFHDPADQEIRIGISDVLTHFDLPAHRPEAIFFNTWIGAELAEALSQRGSFVIGCNTVISSLAAIEFATGFYTALGYGKDYATAFALGRSVLARGAYAAERDKLFAYAEGRRVEV